MNWQNYIIIGVVFALVICVVGFILAVIGDFEND